MQIFQRKVNPMNLKRYQPYPHSELSRAVDRLATLREEMDGLFDTSLLPFFRTPGSFSAWSPAIDVYQDKDQFTVVAEVPGMKKEDLVLSLHNGVLTIAGERKREEKSEQGFSSERFVGRFQRSVTLPASVDPNQVKASYQDGLLKVVLPKSEEAKPKQIEVSVK
jgi:HSP20 family protein